MGIFDKLFPSEEQKLQSQVEELKKEIAALSNRRDLILKETKRIEAERDELKEDYEYEKEKVEEVKAENCLILLMTQSYNLCAIK